MTRENNVVFVSHVSITNPLVSTLLIALCEKSVKMQFKQSEEPSIPRLFFSSSCSDYYYYDYSKDIPSSLQVGLFILSLITMNYFPAANDAEASIQEVLIFVTGASRPPPLGFDEPATIKFADEEPFPMANTCSNTIRLPVCYSEYEEFKTNMDFAIKNSPCFGYA